MHRFLLDTSVYCQPLKPRPHPKVVARWISAGESAICVPVIAEAELLYGLVLKNSARLWRHYEELLKGRYAVIPVDDSIARPFADLKAHCTSVGRPIADLDLLVAAIARHHALAVVTLNARHFRGLPGVAVEDWEQDDTRGT